MVFKSCDIPDKTFETQEQLFAALKENEEKIINLKKSQVYEAHKKDQLSFLNLDVSKLGESEKASFSTKDGFIYPVISTTRFLDSHDDVHFDGCFGKTVKEQQGKVYYALDHRLQFDSIAAWPKDIRMFVADIPWTLVGKDYEGSTQGLVFEIKEEDVRPDVLKAIVDRVADFENSIRMVYYKVRLALNSKAKEDTVYKDYWDSKIDLIANNKEAKDNGYFWGVEELGIYKEGSLVIAGGSNSATSIIQHEDPSEDSQKSIEIQEQNPSKDSQAKEEKRKLIIKQLM